MKISVIFWTLSAVMALGASSFLMFPAIGKGKAKKMARTMWVTAIVLPLGAFSLYLMLGTPEASNNAFADAAFMQQQTIKRQVPEHSASVGSVASLLGGLEEKLRQDPNDAKGWLLLARSYLHLGRIDEAREAYTKARTLGLVDAGFEAKLGDGEALHKVAPRIRGRLTLSEAVKNRVQPNAAVFIFAKAVNGPAMPVAVLRKSVSDLPLDFELSDKQSMSPAAKLSDTETVTVTARISVSGNAMQAEPGLEVSSRLIKVADDDFVELSLGAAQDDK